MVEKGFNGKGVGVNFDKKRVAQIKDNQMKGKQS
jgi:hypothetical protein